MQLQEFTKLDTVMMAPHGVPGRVSLLQKLGLAPGDGTKRVYCEINDNAGNIALTSTTIILDTTPPTGAISINNGATYTATSSVMLSLSYNDANGVSGVHYSNDGVNWGSWESAAQTKAWTLTLGDGTKVVYYQVKDNAGLVSTIYSASIILDTVPPQGSIQINNGAIYTTSGSVTLKLTATDETSGVYQVRYSNDGISWSGWESFSPSRAWVLSAGDGTKTVYYQIKDNVGLPSIYSAIITLDTTPPQGSIKINNGAAYTNSTTVQFTLSATDMLSGMGQMRFSNDNSTWSGWENYSSSKSYNLQSGDGAKTIYVQYKDNAGLSPVVQRFNNSRHNPANTKCGSKPNSNARQQRNFGCKPKH